MMQNRFQQIVTYFLLASALLMPVLLGGCTENGGNTPDNGSDDVTYINYANQTRMFQLDIPTEWELVEEERTTQSWDKFHLSPVGYTSEIYPYLLTIDSSSLSFDQNYEMLQLTNTFLKEDNIDFEDLRARRLLLEHKATGDTQYVYLLEFISQQSILFIMRSDDPKNIAILDHIWGTFDSLR